MTIKISKPLVLAVATAVISLLASCRPAQQARRSSDQAARSRAANNASASGPRQDSILMVQQRLLQLIDTMGDLIEKDHGRIRQLELEISRLRAVLDRYGIQVPMEPVGQAQPGYQPGYQPRPSITGPAGSPSGSPAVPGEQLPRTVPPGAPPIDDRGTVLPMPSPESQSQYQTALQAFNEGRYSQSIDMLTELRRSDPNSAYAPNYEYWRGESFYALGQYERAIQSFTIVQTQFPGSAKSDDAEFKIAESYDKLGDRSRARIAYERLLAVYPDTEYRPRAETKLRRLR